MIRALWIYRGFIWGSIKRDLQARYWRSLLGCVWLVLNPLAMVLIYTLIFAQVMNARLPNSTDRFAYGLYLLAGVLVWNFFAESLFRNITVFVENGNLLKKAAFPRSSLPIITLGSAGINFCIIWALFVGFLIVTRRFPGWSIVAYVPLMLLTAGYSFSIGVLAGSLNVFFRDVGQALGIVMQFWFWLTPIVYPAALLPEWGRQLVYRWNPMAAITKGCQDIILLHQWPDWSTLAVPVGGLVVLLPCAYFVFRRLSPDIVDEL